MLYLLLDKDIRFKISVENNDVESVNQILLENPTYDIDIVLFKGKTALKYAIDKGYTDLARLIANHIDITGCNALHTAVKNKNKDLVQTLINIGVDVNKPSKIYNFTPLHMAACANDIDIITILLKSGAKINIKDKFNETCIYYLLHSRQKLKDNINKCKKNDEKLAKKQELNDNYEIIGKLMLLKDYNLLKHNLNKVLSLSIYEINCILALLKLSLQSGRYGDLEPDMMNLINHENVIKINQQI